MDSKRIQNAILTDGFFIIEDPDVGRRVEDFAKKEYPFQTEDGLTFLQDTLNDRRVVNTVESLFEQSGLGMFRVFGPHPKTARAPLNRTTDELLVLMVFHCLQRSKVIIWKNAHRLELNAKPGNPDTGLLELLSESMPMLGCVKEEVDLPTGGLMILDGRLFSTILEGTILEVAFAHLKELKEWPKMLYHSSLRDKVRGMDRDLITMNCKFMEARKWE